MEILYLENRLKKKMGSQSTLFFYFWDIFKSEYSITKLIIYRQRNENMIRKGLVLGIIILFLVSLFPSGITDPGENDPPIADAGGPYYGNVGENISFNGSGSFDPDGVIFVWKWNFGDGFIGYGEKVEHSYSECGNYTVILTVIDDVMEQDSDTTYAFINAFPVADAGGPYFANLGENITFDASDSYDPDGEIVSYEWVFGDWTNGSGMIINHTYINPGEYTVVLTVEDDFGAISNDTTTAYVNSPPMAPYINGPQIGSPGILYEYVFNSVDPDGDNVIYHIAWGDETSNHTDFNPSGIDVTISHTWAEKGEYTITACAEDIFGATSRTSIFQVTMPRNKAINNPFLNFLQSHPFLFLLLQKLIQQLQFGFGL